MHARILLIQLVIWALDGEINCLLCYLFGVQGKFKVHILETIDRLCIYTWDMVNTVTTQVGSLKNELNYRQLIDINLKSMPRLKVIFFKTKGAHWLQFIAFYGSKHRTRNVTMTRFIKANKVNTRKHQLDTPSVNKTVLRVKLKRVSQIKLAKKLYRTNDKFQALIVQKEYDKHHCQFLNHCLGCTRVCTKINK